MKTIQVGQCGHFCEACARRDDTINRLNATQAELVATLNRIFMRATCAPNDDEAEAGREFTRIMGLAKDALDKATRE